MPPLIQTGRFFGEVDGSVMAQLIRMGMFKRYEPTTVNTPPIPGSDSSLTSIASSSISIIDHYSLRYIIIAMQGITASAQSIKVNVEVTHSHVGPCMYLTCLC